MSMEMRLAGKVAVITGAGDGIGAAVARAFAAEGARVVVAELSEESGCRVADEIDGLFVRTDVGRRDQAEAMVQAALDTFGSVDILVNNAWGAGDIGRVEHKTDAMLDSAFAVGFRGPLWAMQAAHPHMKARGWGRVVNMCSLNGVACAPDLT
jgi:NAD(P)-dependent dehydrogenase (short-subunit alcohol dehydrogenase family)